MAQVVGYFEDDVIYDEGPFVMVNACGSGWRIEVERRGHKCPVLPDPCIYGLLERNGFTSHKTFDRVLVERAVDWLNGQVNLGLIDVEDFEWLPHPELREELHNVAGR